MDAHYGFGYATGESHPYWKSIDFSVVDEEPISYESFADIALIVCAQLQEKKEFAISISAIEHDKSQQYSTLTEKIWEDADEVSLVLERKKGCNVRITHRSTDNKKIFFRGESLDKKSYNILDKIRDASKEYQ